MQKITVNIIAALSVALLLVGIMMMYYRGNSAIANAAADSARTERDNALQVIADINQQLADYQTRVSALDQIARQYEIDKEQSEAVAADIISGLQSGNVQLRAQWRGCEDRLSGVPASAATGERDEDAELRNAGAADLVRIGRDADDHVKACQAVIRAYVGDIW